MSIESFAFLPATITVKVGQSITFGNKDGAPHTVTADDGTSFDSGTLGAGTSKTLVFQTAGTFGYHCAFHPSMKGTIVVVP